MGEPYLEKVILGVSGTSRGESSRVSPREPSERLWFFTAD